MNDEKESKPKWKRIPLRLRMDYYEALVRRAEQNDRYDWQEAERIIKDVLRAYISETPDDA